MVKIFSGFKKQNSSAFTLIELAVAIVIIGFIIGGVAAGSALMQQARLQGIIADFQKYKVAYNNFKQVYNAVPGDFSLAEQYWPAGANGCVALGSGLSCNGNGNGLVEFDLGETVLAMRHLSMAGMIDFRPAQPNGTTVTLGTHIQGITFPRSSDQSGSYQINGYRTSDGHINTAPAMGSPWVAWCNPARVNALWAAKSNTETATDPNGSLSHGFLSGVDVINLEQKIDDGRFSTAFGFWIGGATGKLRGYNHAGAIHAGGDCAVNAPPCDIGFNLNRNPTCIIGFQLDD